MKSLFALALASSLAALAGCTTTASSATPAGPATPPADAADPGAGRGKALAPVMLRWEETAVSPTSAKLVAHVLRRGEFPLPVLVRIDVPAGVKVVAGRTAFTLEPGPAGDTAEAVELSYAAVPPTDLVLHADAESQAMGLHLSTPWRFGRPEPTVTPPAATGPSVEAKGKDLGNSIPLDGSH